MNQPQEFQEFAANFNAILPALDFALAIAYEAEKPIFSKAEQRLLDNAHTRIGNIHSSFMDFEEDEGL